MRDSAQKTLLSLIRYVDLRRFLCQLLEKFPVVYRREDEMLGGACVNCPCVVLK